MLIWTICVVSIITFCLSNSILNVSTHASSIIDLKQGSNTTGNNSTPSFCNCVVFRFDDIQDYYHRNAQLAIMDEFIQKNQSVSLGLIMHVFGNDSEVKDKVKEGFAKGLFELDLHGWDHINYSQLPEKTQEEFLSAADIKMRSIFGKGSEIFIPPYNSFNNTTLAVLSDLKIKVLSSDKFEDSMAYFNATKSGNQSDIYGIYHLPQTIEFNDWYKDEMPKIPVNDILGNTTKNILKYGYAVLTLHPQYFSNVNETTGQETLDKEKMKDLTFVIDQLTASHIKIVPFLKVVSCGTTEVGNEDKRETNK
ncbi:MAG: polysaccharide deacetylase family protein [Candidatus Nitrosocosmicus sp.]|nr:polysaccharide deacetylase family protein [Candidatus Nitrosocosmicus sp.]